MVLVNPKHCLDATHTLVGIELHPFHLIVKESLEYLIEEVLAGSGKANSVSSFFTLVTAAVPREEYVCHSLPVEKYEVGLGSIRVPFSGRGKYEVGLGSIRVPFSGRGKYEVGLG